MRIASNFKFLSTLSLRRATITGYFFNTMQIISIHALLAESDPYKLMIHHAKKISIHALLAESDRAAMPVSGPRLRFLSTLSLRRATKGNVHYMGVYEISIHALLAESDSGINVASNF